MVLCVHEIVQHELFDAVADGVHAAGPLRRTEPEPHLLEISLRESAHGFESHSLRHLRGWNQHSSPVFS